jgi:plastocyanin
MRTNLRLIAIPTLLLAACSGEPADSGAPTNGPASASAATAIPLTGTVIEITMTTNEKGNYFEPAEFTARSGDVLRFKLLQGVHNVNFLQDSTPGHSGLPAATAFAQLPGQTLDVPLTFGIGKFYFQCDPHAMLGMVGHVTVTP